MLISLHKQATTTPKVRAAIQASDEPAWVLAERYRVSEQTVWKWRKRDDVHDLSHPPHRLQTTLTPYGCATSAHMGTGTVVHGSCFATPRLGSVRRALANPRSVMMNR